MICELVAIGTELLLGDVIDTNSAWIAQRLAEHGISCHHQVRVGDNHARIAAVLREALGRADAVICCGGLGPTQDDITREAIAEVMGVPLVLDQAQVEVLEAYFASRGRQMPASNLRQAQVPEGARAIPQQRGTAPGLLCEIRGKVVYAVPGVPSEMQEMVRETVLPDLAGRAGKGVIASRSLHIWGLGESLVAETLDPLLRSLDSPGSPTIAFLASATRGVTVRLSMRAVGDEAGGEAASTLGALERRVRELVDEERIYGTDDQTLESVVAGALVDAELTLAVAESLTGGLLAARASSPRGATAWFRGGVVSYSSEVKHDLLGVTAGPVVCASAAEEMASGVARLLDAEVGLSLTGVAGPETQEGQPVGTVWLGLHLDGRSHSTKLWLGGGRAQIRDLSVAWALDELRRRLSQRR